MSKKCTDIDIIRGETIDATIELTFKGEKVPSTEMQVSYEVIKSPSKEVVHAKGSAVVGNMVFVPITVTAGLLGQYFLRVHILHGQNATIEDIKLEVRK